MAAWHVPDIDAVVSGLILGWKPGQPYSYSAAVDAPTGDLLPLHWELGGGPGLHRGLAISGSALFAPFNNSAHFGRWRLGFTDAEWYATIDGVTGPLLLTSAGTLVFTRCWPGPVCSLSEIVVAGYEHYRVPLPGPHAWGAYASLHNGRWTLGGTNGVRSFDLPGRLMATKGWVAPHGSLAGDRRAR